MSVLASSMLLASCTGERGPPVASSALSEPGSNHASHEISCSHTIGARTQTLPFISHLAAHAL